MFNEKDLYLERNIPESNLEQIEYRGEREFDIGGLKVEYLPFDSRVNPDVVFLLESKAKSINLTKEHRVPFLAESIKDFLEEQEKIKRLGKPLEQIKLINDEQEIEISNYVAPLSDRQVEEIKRWFSMMNSLVKDKFKNFKNIIILPSEGFKLPNGAPVNGRFSKALGGIVLYPPAFEDKKHRIGEVNHLEGTLCHEYFHQYSTTSGGTSLGAEWMKLGGWHLNFSYPEKIQGKNTFSDYETLVESDYGSVDPVEEFCDAAVKAIYNRQEFKDLKKLEFIDENFIDFKNLIDTHEAKVIKKKETEIPEMSKKFNFGIMAVRS